MDLWAQCDLCRKWRKLPQGLIVESTDDFNC